jgi:hypothetical protein
MKVKTSEPVDPLIKLVNPALEPPTDSHKDTINPSAVSLHAKMKTAEDTETQSRSGADFINLRFGQIVSFQI